MSRGQVDEYLRAPRIAKLVTLYPDGSPTVVPVWYEWDGQEARIFTGRGSAKVERIQNDNRVALSVEEPTGNPEAWVVIEGTASIEQEGGFDLARRLAPQYYSRERADAALEQWGRMADEWVVIRVTPKRIRSLAPGT
ncbi:MAG TPA: PPOX class F420-dependent oxidoreductase [Tepidiformaceae bacterium]